MTTKTAATMKHDNLTSDYLLHQTASDDIDLEALASNRLNKKEIVICCKKIDEDISRSILITAANYEEGVEVFLLYPLSIYRDHEEKVCITPFVRVLSKVCKTTEQALTLWSYMRTYSLVSTTPLKFKSGENIICIFSSTPSEVKIGENVISNPPIEAICLSLHGKRHFYYATSDNIYERLLDLLSKR